VIDDCVTLATSSSKAAALATDAASVEFFRDDCQSALEEVVERVCKIVRQSPGTRAAELAIESIAVVARRYHEICREAERVRRAS
jgi:hypothetical protein